MRQKISKKDARLLKREIKALTYRAKGQGEREKARRVSAMVHETIKPENGVIMQYDEGVPNVEHQKALAEHFLHGELTPETAQGIEEFEAEDRERALEEEDEGDATAG
jgi:hypothetical protein